MRTYALRKSMNSLMLILCGFCTCIAIFLLLVILGYVLVNGIRSLSPTLLFSLPAAPGTGSGGIANGIIGSALLTAIAALIGLPIGIGTGIYLAEYDDRRFAPAVRFVAEILTGVPSIIAGIVAYALVVIPTRSFSALAGGVALAIILIPILVRSTEEQLRLVPFTLREAGYALGLPKWRVVLSIVVPAGLRGIITGLMLGIARISGESAPLLFTAFGSEFWPDLGSTIAKPVAALPLYIYRYAISPYNDWRDQAWGASLLLLLFVLLLNIFTRSIVQRGSRARRKA